jgi:hypothetical protein
VTYKDAIDVELEPGQSVLVELDKTGDTKITWDRSKPDEIEVARAAFANARARGMMAYKVTGKDGTKGEIMHEFDPQAERIILAPALRGGRS